MENVPEVVAADVQELEEVLKSSATPDQKLLDTLIRLRGSIHKKLAAIAGENWDEKYPAIQALYEKIQPRIEEVTRVVEAQARFRRAPKERAWRVIKTQSVDLTCHFNGYVTAVVNALETSSMPTVYKKLEALLMYLRDTDADADASGGSWTVVPNTMLSSFKESATRLLAKPDQDEWDGFLQSYFLEMRRRDRAKKRKKKR